MRALFEVSVSAKLRMAHGFTVMYATPRWQASGSPSLHEVSWWHHMKGVSGRFQMGFQVITNDQTM